MKIAIFGGAFNPVHNEHIRMAEAAIRSLGLDRLIVVPTAVSPHKSGRLTAASAQRLEMCRLAFEGVAKAQVSDFEISQGGVSYSYLTCRYFKQEYPEARIYFLMGGDMLANFPRWKNTDEILSLVTLAACARESETQFEQDKKAVEEQFGVRVATVPYVGAKVSSTRIRTLAALGEDAGAYVSPKVWQYMKDNAIYAMENLQKVKDFITPSRWAHTVRVAVKCAENAERAQLTEAEAITMAALHDVAKYLKPDSPYLKGFTCGADVPEPVVHQFAGAYVAANTFGITDKKLIEAIGCHASGKEDMDDAQALLYLADLLEEGRSFEGVEELRAAFDRDLQTCLYLALAHQVEYLSSTGLPVYDQTLKAYRYLKEKKQ